MAEEDVKKKKIPKGVAKVVAGAAIAVAATVAPNPAAADEDAPADPVVTQPQEEIVVEEEVIDEPAIEQVEEEAPAEPVVAQPEEVEAENPGMARRIINDVVGNLKTGDSVGHQKGVGLKEEVVGDAISGVVGTALGSADNALRGAKDLAGGDVKGALNEMVPPVPLVKGIVVNGTTEVLEGVGGGVKSLFTGHPIEAGEKFIKTPFKAIGAVAKTAYGGISMPFRGAKGLKEMAEESADNSSLRDPSSRGSNFPDGDRNEDLFFKDQKNRLVKTAIAGEHKEVVYDGMLRQKDLANIPQERQDEITRLAEGDFEKYGGSWVQEKVDGRRKIYEGDNKPDSFFEAKLSPLEAIKAFRDGGKPGGEKPTVAGQTTEKVKQVATEKVKGVAADAAATGTKEVVKAAVDSQTGGIPVVGDAAGNVAGEVARKTVENNGDVGQAAKDVANNLPKSAMPNGADGVLKDVLPSADKAPKKEMAADNTAKENIKQVMLATPKPPVS
jgi:hypothetical protein